MFRNPSDTKAFVIILFVTIVFIIGVELYYRKLIRPHKLTIEEGNGQIVIRYRQIRRLHFFLSFLAIITLSALTIAIYRSFVESTQFADYLGTAFLMILDIGIIYEATVGFINSTILLATDKTLVISSQPLPTIRKRRKVIHNVHEVYYKKEYSNARTDPGWVYSFFVRTGNDQTIKILDDIDLEDAAIKINHAMQTNLDVNKDLAEQDIAKNSDNRSYIDKLRGYRR
jgi:hypothetical protein